MVETVGVLSILEGAVLVEARRLWRLFETKYGSKGVQSFDHPNLTFQAGRCSGIGAMTDALSHLSRGLYAFEINIDGWACFEIANAIYLKVGLTTGLQRIHEAVNRIVQAYCAEIFANYLPDQWQPHITVAMGDLSNADFCRAKQDLSTYHPRYQQILSNLHLVHLDHKSGHVEIVQSYTLRR